MTPEIEHAIRVHAAQAFPAESCGLVLDVDGVKQYVPCTNLSDEADDAFVLSPDDYAAAEDAGEVLAIVHSHPSGSAVPSQADLVRCELTGLPWLIVAVERVTGSEFATAGEISTTTPSSYVAPLLGREFSHGVLDCYSLIKDFYQRELGIELPEFERSDKWWEKGENLYMDHFADAGMTPINDDPQYGDVIIMQLRAKVPNHAAVYLGDGTMMHHVLGRLSAREMFGGYWQKITRVIVRHGDMQP